MVQEEESVASIYRGHSSIHVCWDTLGEYIATNNTLLYKNPLVALLPKSYNCMSYFFSLKDTLSI